MYAYVYTSIYLSIYLNYPDTIFHLRSKQYRKHASILFQSCQGNYRPYYIIRRRLSSIRSNGCVVGFEGSTSIMTHLMDDFLDQRWMQIKWEWCRVDRAGEASRMWGCGAVSQLGWRTLEGGMLWPKFSELK